MLLSALIPLATAGLATLVGVTWQSQLALVNVGYMMVLWWWAVSAGAEVGCVLTMAVGGGAREVGSCGTTVVIFGCGSR
jgi:hypothetical protein